MSTIKITFTREDVTTLQATVSKLPKWTYPTSPDYEPPAVLLTDNDSPLDLFCLVDGVGTHNECIDNSIDWIAEQKTYIRDEHLNYQGAFIGTLSAEKKAFYRENIPEFEKDLATFEEEQKEKLIDETALDVLQSEYERQTEEIYNDLYKQYLHGDYREAGALYHLEKYGKYESVAYNEKEDILTLGVDSEDYEDMTPDQIKTALLRFCKNKREEQAKENRRKSEDRKKEHEERQKRKQAAELARIERLKSELV